MFTLTVLISLPLVTECCCTLFFFHRTTMHLLHLYELWIIVSCTLINARIILKVAHFWTATQSLSHCNYHYHYFLASHPMLYISCIITLSLWCKTLLTVLNIHYIQSLLENIIEHCYYRVLSFDGCTYNVMHACSLCLICYPWYFHSPA